MAKKDEAPVDPRGGFLDSVIKEAQKKFGDKSAYMIEEHEARTFGIPLTNLALMYVTDSNIWPLQRITFTHGVEQSGKSAFFYWLCQLFVKNGGTGEVISTESKDSPSLMNSLLGEERKFVGYKVGKTAQEWQWHITNAIKKYKKQFTKTVGEGKNKKEMFSGDGFPMVVGVDSLQGVMDEEAKKAIIAQGYAAARGFPVTALANTKYMQAITSELVGYPITMHFVNHVKPKMDATGAEKGKNITGMSSRAAGAVHQRFANSLDLWFNRGQDHKPTEDRPWNGFEVNIRVNKSSFGDAHRTLSAELCWKRDDNAPGGQITWWNWDMTTAKMLRTIHEYHKKHPIWDVLSGFSENSKKYSCKALGLTAVQAHEIGEAINGDEKMLNQCVEAFGIHRYQTFAPGIM